MPLPGISTSMSLTPMKEGTAVGQPLGHHRIQGMRIDSAKLTLMEVRRDSTVGFPVGDVRMENEDTERAI